MKRKLNEDETKLNEAKLKHGRYLAILADIKKEFDKQKEENESGCSSCSRAHISMLWGKCGHPICPNCAREIWIHTVSRGKGTKGTKGTKDTSKGTEGTLNWTKIETCCPKIQLPILQHEITFWSDDSLCKDTFLWVSFPCPFYNCEESWHPHELTPLALQWISTRVIWTKAQLKHTLGSKFVKAQRQEESKHCPCSVSCHETTQESLKCFLSQISNLLVKSLSTNIRGKALEVWCNVCQRTQTSFVDHLTLHQVANT